MIVYDFPWSSPHSHHSNPRQKEGNSQKITEYTTKYNYIRYPIPDRKIPEDWKTFTEFILKLSSTIRHLKSKDDDNHELLYLHCKGGHGRSGVVVACLLCYMGNYFPEKALELTSHYHSKRKNMREIWRTMGAPQNHVQKNFVYRFFEVIYFLKAYNHHSFIICGVKANRQHTSINIQFA